MWVPRQWATGRVGIKKRGASKTRKPWLSSKTRSSAELGQAKHDNLRTRAGLALVVALRAGAAAGALGLGVSGWARRCWLVRARGTCCDWASAPHRSDWKRKKPGTVPARDDLRPLEGRVRAGGTHRWYFEAYRRGLKDATRGRARPLRGRQPPARRAGVPPGRLRCARLLDYPRAHDRADLAVALRHCPSPDELARIQLKCEQCFCTSSTGTSLVPVPTPFPPFRPRT